MLEDLRDDILFIDETDDPHLGAAFDAEQWIDLPDFFYAFTPGRRRNLAWLVTRDVDDLDFFLVRLCFLGQLLFQAVTTHAVRVPTIIAHQLKRLLRNMLGDGGDELLRRVDFKVAFPFAVIHLGLVDHRAGIGIVGDLLFGKWIEVSQVRLSPDDVLGQSFPALFVFPADTHPVVHGKTRIVPPLEEHGDDGVVDLAFFFQHGQDVGAVQFRQGAQVETRHDMEGAVGAEQAVCHQGVDVRVPLGIVAKSLDSHDHVGDHRSEETELLDKFLLVAQSKVDIMFP